MSFEAAKRKRSPNWHTSEKDILLTLVEKYADIVENKRTDGSSIREKQAHWEKVANIFNSQTALCNRSAANLKAEWELLKKAAKKEAALRRMEANKTGGGTLLKRWNPLHDRVMRIIGHAAVGFNNPFDCDAGMIQPSSEAVPEQITVEVESDAVQASVVEIEQEDEARPVEESQPSPTTLSITQIGWESFTPQLLRMPISKALQEEGEPERHRTSANRRRPTVSKTSMELLHDKKIEALELQIQHAKEERREAAERGREAAERAREAAERTKEAAEAHVLEMDLRRERLRQEKLKTRILLLELRNKRNQ